MARLVWVFLLIPAVISVINAQCTVEKAKNSFSRGLYEFSSEITKRYAYQTDNHFVLSPISLWTLISAISEGADGETLNEIQKTLHHHPHKCFTHKYYKIIESIKPADGVVIEKSGTLVLDENLLVKDNFKSKVKRLGICDFLYLSFRNFDDTAAFINNYVETATHGAINEIVSPEDIQDQVVVLLDAIYFEGKWKIPFDRVETEISTFYDEDNKEIGDVNLMYSTSDYKSFEVDKLKATILELPYGSSEFSMLVVLPKVGEPLSNVFDSLLNISLRSILYLLNNAESHTVQVSLPRFKISSSLENLKELLVDMGLTTMFDLTASFPYITNLPVNVGNLIQKAFIEVTEEGTVGSAVSEAGLESRFLPAEFNANRPFIYLIVEKEAGVVLFSGAYSKPSLY